MRKDLMEILVCPVCKGELTLTIDKEEGEEILSGDLRCTPCRATYPIEDGIPNMIPEALRT